MNTITMLQTASILLLLTALGGLAMASVRFARKINPPSWLAMAHGFLAASGLTLLTYAGLTDRVHGAAMTGLAGLEAASAGIPYDLTAADMQLPSDFSGFQNVGAQPGTGLDTSALYNGGDMGGFSGAGAGNGAPMDYSALYNGGNAGGACVACGRRDRGRHHEFGLPPCREGSSGVASFPSYCTCSRWHAARDVERLGRLAPLPR